MSNMIASLQERNATPLGHTRALAAFELDLVGGATNLGEVFTGIAVTAGAVASAALLPVAAPALAVGATLVAAAAGGVAIAHGLFG